MLNIPGLKENTNQNYIKISPHCSQNGYHQETQTTTNVGEEYKLIQPLWKAEWKFLKKLRIQLPYDPAILLLGIYLKECNSGYSKHTCTLTLIIHNSHAMKIAQMPNN
jgi:hypothetical protein